MTRPTPETDSVIAANHENGWTGATGIEMLEELACRLESDRDALRERLKVAENDIDIALRRLDEETAIVNRVWSLFGNPEYKELKGRSLYDLIAAALAAKEPR